MALGVLEIIVLAIILILFLSFFFRLLRMSSSPSRVAPQNPGRLVRKDVDF